MTATKPGRNLYDQPTIEQIVQEVMDYPFEGNITGLATHVRRVMSKYFPEPSPRDIAETIVWDVLGDGSELWRERLIRQIAEAIEEARLQASPEGIR